MKIVLLILNLFVLVACGSQNPPKMRSEIRLSAEDREQIKECSTLDLTQTPLAQKNALQLFRCLKWSKEYGSLYSELSKINEQNWNHLTSPLNDFIFKNEDNKLKLLRFMITLKESGDLESMKASTEKILKIPGIITTLKNVLQKTQKSSELQSLLNFVYQHPEYIFSLSTVARYALYPYSLDSQKDLGFYLKSFWNNKDYLNHRHLAINALMKSISTFEEKETHKILGALYYPNPQNPWLMALLASPFTNRQDYIDVLTYPIFNYPEISDDSKILMNFKNDSPYCQSKTGKEAGIKIVFEQETYNMMKSLVMESPDVFMNRLIESFSKVRLVHKTCSFDPEYDSVDYALGTSHKNLMKGLTGFLQNGMGYYFLKLSTSSLFDEKDTSTSTTLVEVLASDFANEFLKAQVAIKDHESFMPLISATYDYAKNLPLEVLTKAYPILKDVLDKPSLLKDVAGLWQSLDEKDQKNLLALMDQFLDKDLNFYPMINLMVKLQDELPEMFPLLVENALDTQENQQKSLGFIIEVLTALEKEDVQNDVIKMINAPALDTMITLLQSGLKAFKIEEVVPQEKTDYVFAKYDAKEYEKSINCIKSYYDLLKTHEQVIFKIPGECRSLGKLPYVTKMMGWLEDAELKFKYNFSTETLFSQYGMLSQDMLHMSMSQMIILKQVLDKSVDVHNMHEFVSLLKSNIEDNHLLTLLDSLIGFLGKHILKEAVFKDIIKTVATTSEQDVKMLLTSSHDLLTQYVRFNNNATFKVIPSCRQSFPKDFGAYPYCYKQDYLEAHVFSMLDILKRKFGNSPRLIEIMLETFYPEKGIEIPFHPKKKKKKFEASKRMKVISISEFVHFLYDMSDASTDLNIKYHYSKNKSENVKVTTLQAQEIMLRDAAYANNFYGAFFLNSVSSGMVYDKRLKLLKFEVGLLDDLNFILKPIAKLPEESTYLNKNARSAFPALKVVSQNRKDLQGNEYNYSDMIQAFATALVKSSDESVQHYGPLEVDFTFGDKHNGAFFTEMGKASIMSHAARYLRARIGNDYNAFAQNQDFKNIDNRLMKLVSLPVIKNTAVTVLDKYYKSNNDIISVMLTDAISKVDSLDALTLRKLEQTTWNMLSLVSRSDLRDGALDPLMKDLPSIIELYPLAKKYLPKEAKIEDMILDLYKLSAYLNKDSSKQPMINTMLKIALASATKSSVVHDLVAMIKKDPAYFIPELYKNYKMIRDTLVKMDLNSLGRIVNIISEMSRHPKFSMAAALMDGDSESVMKMKIDWLTKFVYFLSLEEEGKTNLNKALTTLLESSDELEKMLDELTQLIKF